MQAAGEFGKPKLIIFASTGRAARGWLVEAHMNVIIDSFDCAKFIPGYMPNAITWFEVFHVLCFDFHGALVFVVLLMKRSVAEKGAHVGSE